MVADQDPGSPQQLIQTPLVAVRLGSAHFGDVMIGFPNRGVDGWWECPTVIKVGKITQTWDAKLLPVSSRIFQYFAATPSFTSSQEWLNTKPKPRSTRKPKS